MIAPITMSQSKRLAELEKVIKRGSETFVEVGNALAEIREGKLYKSEHSTFEEYCREKWSFTRQYVNQIIASAVTVQALPPVLETMVSNQRQARALSQVEPEKRVQVIEAAKAQADAEDRPMTARDISEAAEPEVVVLRTVGDDMRAAFGGVIPGVPNHEVVTADAYAAFLEKFDAAFAAANALTGHNRVKASEVFSAAPRNLRKLE